MESAAKARRRAQTALAVLAVIGIGACSSAPTRSGRLDEAKDAVAQLDRSPLTTKFAALDAERAHETLERADKLAQKKETPDEVEHLAYLATRYADIASAKVAAAQAQASVEQSEAQRNELLAKLRTEHEADSRRSAEAIAADERRRAGVLQQQLAQLNAQPSDRGWTLVLDETAFNAGKTTFKSNAALTLDPLADLLKEAPDRYVVVEGQVEGAADDLSQRRAIAVRAALLQRGIAAERVGIGSQDTGSQEQATGHANANIPVSKSRAIHRVAIVVLNPKS